MSHGSELKSPGAMALRADAAEAQLKALGAGLQVLSDTAKAEIERLTEHLRRIENMHAPTAGPGGPQEYARLVVTEKLEKEDEE